MIQNREEGKHTATGKNKGDLQETAVAFCLPITFNFTDRSEIALV